MQQQTQTRRFRSMKACNSWVQSMTRAGWKLQSTPGVAGLGIGALREFVATMVWEPVPVAAIGPPGYTQLEQWLIDQVQTLHREVAELKARLGAGVAA